MSSVLTEALKEIIGSNGNGNGHANGNGKSPSEKAWDTAREEARKQGQTVRDDEIRCIKNKGMTAWAKLLFWILSKICWETSPFLHKGRVGSVCITGRQLKANFSFPEKRLYSQTKRVKDKTSGEVLTSRKVPGAIDELVSAGLLWVGKKPITNLPKNKWPNVFNLCALVSQVEQQNLGLLEDVTLVDDSATDGGSSLFLPENRNGSGHTPQNGLAKPRFEPLATTNGGSGHTPLAGVGHNRRGELATTNGGSSAATNGGGRRQPTGGVAKGATPGLPDPASGAPIKTVRHSTDLSDSTNPLPQPTFEDLDRKMYAREREKKGRTDLEYLTVRINSLEQSRTPAPNQKEVIKAYKARRMEVKKWMAGEL